MKRPNSVSNNRGQLPTRPNTDGPKPKPKKAKPVKAGNPRAAKLAKASSFAKPKRDKSVANNAVGRVQLKREQRKLEAIRQAGKTSRRDQTRQFASEIRRFTVASRRRRYVTLTALGAVSSLLIILLATWFTPILSIEKIEISGLSRLKEKSVSKAVESLIGTPLTLVDENEIAKRLANFPLIESFSTISNPPHELQIRIVERQPIAIVLLGEQPYLFDAAGVQVGQATESDRFPVVDITGNPAKSENYRQAIDVLLSLPVELNNKVASIRAKSKDDVQLRLTGYTSRVVIWGDSSDSILKSKVLSALLKTTRKKVSVVFDVSSPSAPAVRYLNY